MSETAEMPMPQEMKTENPVVASVKGAIDKAAQDTKNVNQEYWEIRKELQGRLDWHGGGIIKMYVQQMDKVTDVLWGGENRSWGAKLMGMKDKLWTRISGAFLGLSSAAADLPINAITWPFRHFIPLLPIPKDPMKRLAVGATHALTLGAAEQTAALIAAKKAAQAQQEAGRRAREIQEGVVTAPEVAATMLGRRAEKALYNILHPKGVQKPAGK